MQKISQNHAKKMAQLRYKEEIIDLSKDKSIREITEIINKKIAHTILKTKLSKSTIAKIIKDST